MLDKFTIWLNRTSTIYLLMAIAFIIRAGFGIAIGERYLPMADQIAFDELARNLSAGKGLVITDRLILPQKEFPPEVVERFYTRPERIRDLRMGALWGVIQPYKPTAFFEPLVPMVFGVVYKVFGEGLLAPRILQSLLDALVVGMIFALGTIALPKSRAPGISALIYAFYPFSIMFTGALITQPIYLFLQFATIYLFYRFILDPGWTNGLLFGLAFGMTILSRISLLTFAPFFLLALWAQNFKKPNWEQIVSALLLAGIMLLPWVIRNQHSLGEPLLLPTKGGRNLWEYNNQVFARENVSRDFDDFEGVDVIYNKFAKMHLSELKAKQYIEFPEFTNESEVERDRILNQRVQIFIRANPGIYLKLCVMRLYQFFRITPSHHQHLFFKIAAWGSFGWILPLSFWGMVLLVGQWRKLGVVYLLIWYNIGVHTLTASGIPHRLPIDPFLIIFASFSLCWLGEKFKLLQKE